MLSIQLLDSFRLLSSTFAIFSFLSVIDLLAQHLRERLGISLGEQVEEEKQEPLLEEFTIAGIAKYIKSNKCEFEV